VPAKLRRGGGGRWFEFPTHEGGEDGAVLVAGKGNENHRSTDKKRKSPVTMKKKGVPIGARRKEMDFFMLLRL
jgi:hypothetical protein